ncbi:MAG: glutamate decarboxylase [Clostridia bacterium]
MWTVVYIARNKREAFIIEEKLKNESFLVHINCNSNEDTGNFEIAVLELEAEDAIEIINQIIANNFK